MKKKVYNYLGENMYDMYGGDDAWMAGKKAHTGKVDTPIAIVYDGKAPRRAAKKLHQHLNDMGYETELMDADDYSKGHSGSVIVVGHHKLAKEFLKYLGAKYDTYGMKYGFSGNLCVLCASRSALGNGKEGRKAFSKHYNRTIPSHLDLANQYNIPMAFGYRRRTRESQYDLLLLEFIKYGLGMFLGEKMAGTDHEQDLVNSVVSNLVEKFEKDKDMVFSLNDSLCNCKQQHKEEGIQTLYTHLGEDIVITDLWENAMNVRELDESELFDGELSAYTFQVGSYIIRSAQRVYQDTNEVHYTQRIPAAPDAMAAYAKRQEIEAWCWSCRGEGVREVCEISAKYISTEKDTTPDSWIHICVATNSLSWFEEINFIGTVKVDPTADDVQSELFVLKEFNGSSFRVSDWYRLAPNGKVLTYEEHPYNPDSFHKSWRIDE